MHMETDAPILIEHVHMSWFAANYRQRGLGWGELNVNPTTGEYWLWLPWPRHLSPWLEYLR